MIDMKELEGMTRSHISSERQFIRDRMYEFMASDDLARAYVWPFKKDKEKVRQAKNNEKTMYKELGVNEAKDVCVKLYGDRLYIFRRGDSNA